MSKDLRSPLAKARDDWFESADGVDCQSGVTSGQYLRNRLEKAFLAGAKFVSHNQETIGLVRELATFNPRKITRKRKAKLVRQWRGTESGQAQSSR